MDAAVQERLDRMQAPYVDLLQVRRGITRRNIDSITYDTQFYWSDYDDKRYLTALRHLEELQRGGKIVSLGLCNFDTLRTDEICAHLGPGVIATNQVQVFLLSSDVERAIFHL